MPAHTLSEPVFERIFEVELPPAVSADTIRRAASEVEAALGFPVPEDWDWAWQLPPHSGTYTGSLPTRLKSWMYKENRKKVAPEKLAELGEKLKRLLPSPEAYPIDLTRKLDWRPGDFMDGWSCFFSYKKAKSLPLILNSGGFALRAWQKGKSQWYDQYRPLGRAFVMPHEDGWVVSNQAGSPGKKMLAALLAQLLGGETVPVAAKTGPYAGLGWYYYTNDYSDLDGSWWVIPKGTAKKRPKRIDLVLVPVEGVEYDASENY